MLCIREGDHNLKFQVAYLISNAPEGAERAVLEQYHAQV
jgi:hypothetical protein